MSRHIGGRQQRRGRRHQDSGGQEDSRDILHRVRVPGQSEQ